MEFQFNVALKNIKREKKNSKNPNWKLFLDMTEFIHFINSIVNLLFPVCERQREWEKEGIWNKKVELFLVDLVYW